MDDRTTGLAEIASRLPSAVTRLCRGVSPHDAVIESVRWKPSVAELCLALIAETKQAGYQAIHLTYRGAMLGKQRITSLRKAAQNRDACVLYQEVDIADDGTLAHRLLFWPSEEVSIHFRDLEYACTPRDDSRVTLGGAFLVEEDREERG